MSTAAAIQHDEVIDLTTPHPERDVHDGRPVCPEYAERGAALMAQWAAEDAK